MTTPNHTAADALAYIANIVKDRIDFATDAISSNIPSINASAEELYDGNEYVLDMLGDLAKDVLDAVRPHCDGPAYSDGRPIWSNVENPETNSTFTHYWNPDPTKDIRREWTLRTARGRRIVTLSPPSTVDSVYIEDICAVPDAAESSLTDQ
ncbi:hypothetical protein ACIBM3_22985 [Rhodococcus erythropolis]|uniref:hypothetical protein n=1 Tax=Rhodococcus erythropolis TaxID=1833 RepID=UPI00379A3331